MGAYFKILLYSLTSAFKPRGRLAAENTALRHEALVLKRKHRGGIRWHDLDRCPLQLHRPGIFVMKSAEMMVRATHTAPSIHTNAIPGTA